MNEEAIFWAFVKRINFLVDIGEDRLSPKQDAELGLLSDMVWEYENRLYGEDRLF